MIRISIVTPSFNQAQYLEQTIQSVISQKYENLQYIIIDGGSTDGSVEIIKKYSNNLDFWISELDSGQSEAINKGLLKCDGEVFNWINSDDLLAEGCLHYVASAFEDPNVDVLAGSYELFYNNDIKTGQLIAYHPLKAINHTIGNALIHQPSTFMRMDKIGELGFLNQSLNYIMDQDLWIRYLLKFGQKKVRITDKKLAYFRVHSTSKTFNFGNDKFWEERDSYFYTLAIKAGLTKQADAMITENPNLVELEVNSNGLQNNNQLITKAINSQFEYRARQLIYNKDFKKALSLIKVISDSYLFLILYLRIKADPLIHSMKKLNPDK